MAACCDRNGDDPMILTETFPNKMMCITESVRPFI